MNTTLIEDKKGLLNLNQDNLYALEPEVALYKAVVARSLHDLDDICYRFDKRAVKLIKSYSVKIKTKRHADRWKSIKDPAHALRRQLTHEIKGILNHSFIEPNSTTMELMYIIDYLIDQDDLRRHLDYAIINYDQTILNRVRNYAINVIKKYPHSYNFLKEFHNDTRS